MSSAAINSNQAGGTLDKSTKVTLGFVGGLLLLVSSAIGGWVTHAKAQSARDTRVDMQLEHHSKRLDSLEAKSDYAYDALRRLEYRMGTLPPSVPLPPRE